MIREADKTLKSAWRHRFLSLPMEARSVLRSALMDLREDALARAEHCWKKHKAPMALYWKVVGVYSGHLARAIQLDPEILVDYKVGDPVHRTDIDPNCPPPDNAWGTVEEVYGKLVKVDGQWYPASDYTYDYDEAWNRQELADDIGADPPLESDLDSIVMQFPDAFPSLARLLSDEEA